MNVMNLIKPLSLTLAAAVITACVSDPAPSSSSSAGVSSSVAVSSSSSIAPISSSSASVSSVVSSMPPSSSSSIVASSSSSVAPSSSSSVSSAASSSSAQAGEPNLVRGEQLYKNNGLLCSACHKADGAGGGAFPAINNPAAFNFASSDLDGLAAYIQSDMLTKYSADTSACDANCPRDIAAYILNGFSTGQSSSSSSSTPTTGVSPAAQAARVAAGKQAYSDNACGLCHRDDGETLVQFGSGDAIKSRSLKNCPSCESYDALVGAITATMPKGDNEFGPTSCVGECAKAAADYIWVEIIGGTLTVSGGFLPNTPKESGLDTLRIKSYDAIAADYERVFGEIPSDLENGKSAFRETPKFWYEERSIGAVSLNVLANAAVQACSNEALPANNPTAIRNACANWAERMWLRSATTDELDSCVATATTVTDDLANSDKQLIFACASMMISIPALTY